MNPAAMSASLPLYPVNVARLGKIGAVLIGALCASILFGLLVIGKHHSVVLLDVITLQACIVQLLAIVFQGQALGRSVSVLQAQRAPAALWQAWLRQWLVSVSRYWLLLSIAVAALMLTPASPRHWLAAPALLSLLLCCGTLAVLARAGLLPRRLGFALEIVLLALVVVLTATQQMMRALHIFSALPTWVLLACVLAWPANACWILHSQSGAMRTLAGTQTNTLRRLRDAIARWASRFQPLRDERSASAPGTSRRTLLVLAIMQNAIFFAQLMPVHWGEEVHTVRLSRLAVICIICFNALLVRDVHWRSLLLPGGTQLRWLGTRIMLSTMLFQVPVLLAFAVGSALLSRQPWGLDTLAGVAVPLLELACCTTLLTMIRSFPYRVQIGTLMAMGIPMMYFSLMQLFKFTTLQLTWEIGPAYVLLLTVLTGTAMTVANRRWTPKRLLQALPTT